MATSRLSLLIPVTLCSFLLVLAAAEQGEQATTTLLHVSGIARCSSNFSRIISNAPMYLVINNATVPGGTGRTTSDGQLLMTVNLNSTEQVAAVMSNGNSKAFIVAPRNACGVPHLPPGKEMAAAVKPIDVVTISDDNGGAAGISVQRPAVAASVTMPLPARAMMNSRLHATKNNGDAVHLNDGVVQIILSKMSCVVCAAITVGDIIRIHG